MVSRHVSADPVGTVSRGPGASVGSQLQHGLVAEAQTDAGDEGTGPAGWATSCRWTTYLGGETRGGKRGRGAQGKTPFVAAVQVTEEGRPVPQAGDCGLGPPASAAGDGGLLGRTGLLPVEEAVNPPRGAGPGDGSGLGRRIRSAAINRRITRIWFLVGVQTLPYHRGAFVTFLSFGLRADVSYHWREMRTKPSLVYHLRGMHPEEIRFRETHGRRRHSPPAGTLPAVVR